MTTSQATVPAHVPAHLVHEFDLYHPAGVEQDFHLALKRLHDPGVPDIFWTPCNGGHWVAARGQAMRHIFQDHVHFSNAKMTVPKANNPSQPLLPINADPPAHAAYRNLIAPAFAPRAVAACEQEARELSISLIDGFRADGGCEFVSQFAAFLPIGIFMHMVDLPAKDRLYLMGLADEMQRLGRRPKDEVIGEVMGYLDGVIRTRREQPGADLISQIVHARIDGRTLDHGEVLRMCTLLLFGGLDTVKSMLGFIANFLARHPAHRRELIDAPELLPNAVEELLRRFGLANPGRIVAREHEYAGVRFLQGDMIILPTCLHGLDEREHTDPLAVNFHRPMPIVHSTFGNGPHRCPGAILARIEISVFLREWLARIPDFQVAPGATPVIRAGVNGCFETLPLTWAA
ncbi:MAG: cytochrome P450 [Gammaproteobacteria bacterium]